MNIELLLFQTVIGSIIVLWLSIIRVRKEIQDVKEYLCKTYHLSCDELGYLQSLTQRIRQNEWLTKQEYSWLISVVERRIKAEGY